MSASLDEVIFLELEDVIAMHADQLRLFGGIDGIRDNPALASAVATPRATFAGAFLHDDIFLMAAAYAFHIAENQPFLDGNKRTGLNAALVFLDINGWLVLDPDGRLYGATLGLANHTSDKSTLAALLRELATPDSQRP